MGFGSVILLPRRAARMSFGRNILLPRCSILRKGTEKNFYGHIELFNKACV